MGARALRNAPNEGSAVQQRHTDRPHAHTNLEAPDACQDEWIKAETALNRSRRGRQTTPSCRTELEHKIQTMPRPKSPAAAKKPRALAKAATTAETPSSRLTRDDWLDAAFQAAITGGFGAVRVLTLADTLGVSRGSFYWHFADHAELVHALVDRWYQRQLVSEKRMLEGELADPVERILQILDNAIAHSVEEREYDRFELALRALADKDKAVATQLEKVDRRRLQLVYTHYAKLVGDDEKARELSALFYLAVVGSHQAMNRPSSNAKVSDYLKSIIAKHLVHAVQIRS